MIARSVLFFGGKGGVGKTTMASAWSLYFSRDGARTLLVSTDPAHSVADVLEREVGAEPTEVQPNLWAMEIDPETETDRYIADVKERISETTAPRLVAEIERQIDVARISPGAEESALFDRFTIIMRDLGDKYDRIVFDTAPTGHTLRLLSLPELMTAWISGLIAQRRKVNTLSKMWNKVAKGGAEVEPDEDPVLSSLQERQRRFVEARGVLTDEGKAGFVFVVTPERLPVLETEKSVRTLDKYGVPVAGVILNRVLPEGDLGEFLEQRREREQEYVNRAMASFPDHPIFRVPLLATDVSGIEALGRVLAETRS